MAVVAAVLLAGTVISTIWWAVGRWRRPVAQQRMARESRSFRLAPSAMAKYRALLDQLPGPEAGRTKGGEVVPSGLPEVLSSDAMLEAEIASKLALIPERERLLVDQQRRFVEIFAVYQAIRAKFESEIATVRYLGPDRVEIEIPPYPESGRLLRQSFEGEVVDAVGQENFDRIMASMGDDLFARFKAFGNTRQTIAAQAVMLPDGRVEFKIQWSSVATQDVGPFPSGAEGRFGGNSYAYTLLPEQLQDGEWYGFGGYIAKLRPKG